MPSKKPQVKLCVNEDTLFCLKCASGEWLNSFFVGNVLGEDKNRTEQAIRVARAVDNANSVLHMVAYSPIGPVEKAVTEFVERLRSEKEESKRKSLTPPTV